MKKALCLVLVALLMLSSVAAFAEAPEYKVAILASFYSAAIDYADQKGYDLEEGIDIVPQQFASGAPMNEAFAAGELDAADMGPAAVHAVGKFNAKVIAQNAKQVACQLIIKPESDIAQAGPDENGVYGTADLVRGKTIMGPVGTYSHYLIIGWLNYLGLTIDDVNYVNMDYPTASQAFETDQGEVCAMQNPNVYDAQAKGYISVGDPAFIAPMYENLIASNEAYTEKRDQTKAFLKVVYRAQEELLADDALAAQVLGDFYAKVGYTASPEAVMDEVQNQRPLLSLAEAAMVPVGDSLVDTAVFMQSLGQIEQSQTDMVSENLKGDILQEICTEAGIAFAE
ncbi:MAG: ABC transporter substrate-binding protein [Clostridia bacterium]|nr:ABC transporter substrate-binding protein [Clostridia bacterium]